MVLITTGFYESHFFVYIENAIRQLNESKTYQGISIMQVVTLTKNTYKKLSLNLRSLG